MYIHISLCSREQIANVCKCWQAIYDTLIANLQISGDKPSHKNVGMQSGCFCVVWLAHVMQMNMSFPSFPKPANP